MLSNSNINERFIKFPEVVSVLWDSTPRGNSFTLNLSSFKNIQIFLQENVKQSLRSLDKSGEEYFLFGEVSPEFKGTQDLVINITDVSKDLKGGEAFPETYLCSLSYVEITDIQNNHLGFLKDNLKMKYTNLEEDRLTHRRTLFSGKGIYSYINANDDACSVKMSLNMAVVVNNVGFMLTPVAPVPFIETALARYLLLNISCYNYSTETKTGYISMDKRRRIIYVLKSDPNAVRIPIIGIWISGIVDVGCPKVWLACAQYYFNTHLKRKLYCGKKSFLVAAFCQGSTKPVFYQCNIPKEEQNEYFLVFQNETSFFNLDWPPSKLILNFQDEICSEKHNHLITVMDSSYHKKSTPRNSFSRIHRNEAQPQSIPSPHPRSPQEGTSLKPNVPDLSLNIGNLSLPSEIENSKCLEDVSDLSSRLNETISKDEKSLDDLIIIGNKLESFLQKMSMKDNDMRTTSSPLKQANDKVQRISETVEEVSEIELPRNNQHSMSFQEEVITSFNKFNMFVMSSNTKKTIVPGISFNDPSLNDKSMDFDAVNHYSHINTLEDPISPPPSINLHSEDFSKLNNLSILTENEASVLLSKLETEDQLNTMGKNIQPKLLLNSSKSAVEHQRSISVSTNLENLLDYKIPIWDLSLVSVCNNECSICQGSSISKQLWSPFATKNNFSLQINKMALKYLNRSETAASSFSMSFDEYMFTISEKRINKLNS